MHTIQISILLKKTVRKTSSPSRLANRSRERRPIAFSQRRISSQKTFESNHQQQFFISNRAQSTWKL
eukprot:scaffold270821_cov34-Prasinocladus_malaysianus.AAC.1